MSMLEDHSYRESSELDDQAEAWVVRMHSGHFSPEDSHEMEAWLARDASHQRAFQNALALWEKIPLAIKRTPTRTKRWPLVLTASAALLVGVLAVGWNRMHSGEQPVAQPALPRSYQTRLGERSTVKLEDGSTLQLNSNTQATVEITPARRRIVLKQGQLFAAVAKDPLRPFEVEALNGTTRAVGTEFDVQMEVDVVTVIDISGRVSVTPVEMVETAGKAAKDWAVLNAGKGLRYSAKGPLGDPFNVDIDSISAWRSGFWSFENAALETVAKTVRNYHVVYIEFDSPRTAALTLTGRFKIGDLDTLLKTIALAHPVVVTRPTENTILISSK